MIYKIEKVIITNSIMKELIELSKEWKNEAITYGIVANTKQDFVAKDIYVAYNSRNKIIGYLLCSFYDEDNGSSTIPKGSKVCYVDEIYVKKAYRNKGVGTELFNKMNEDIIVKCDYIKLVTSTKDHKKIIHFYEDILKMNFFSACFFKKI